MQQLQHKLFTMLPGTLWNEQHSLPICDIYVPASIGFSAIGKLNNGYKIRPWFER